VSWTVADYRRFDAHVSPFVRGCLGGGDLIHIERCGCTACRALDTSAVIDCLHRDTMGLVGIAVRMQYRHEEWDERWPWDTFTIRAARSTGAPTELHKLHNCRRSLRFLGPSYHVHAYFDGDTLDSIGLIATADILAHAELADQRVTHEGDAAFHVYAWSDLAPHSPSLACWHRSAEGAA